MEFFNEFKLVIYPKLDELEKVRVKEHRKYLCAHLLYLLVPLVFLAGNSVLEDKVNGFYLGLFLSVLVTYAIYKLVVQALASRYVRTFKINILKELVSMLYPEVNYDYNEFVSSTCFRDSNLFGDKFVNYTGEDYFNGKTPQGYSFQFSEIDSKIKQFDKLKTLFKGVFFELRIPGVYFPATKILSNKTANDSIYLSSVDSSLLMKSIRLSASLPSLSRISTVYSTLSEDDSIKFLNLSILQVVLDLSEDWDECFKIIFQKEKIYIAVPTSTNFFHVKINQPIHDNLLLQKIYSELEKCFRVVNNFSNVIETLDEELLKIEKEERNVDGVDDGALYNHLLDFDE